MKRFILWAVPRLTLCGRCGQWYESSRSKCPHCG
jgi:predicted amidophosphoribosyltransferase